MTEMAAVPGAGAMGLEDVSDDGGGEEEGVAQEPRLGTDSP